MISANIAAARFMEKHQIPGLYRVHKGPKEEKIEDVKDFITGLGLRFKGNSKSAIKNFITGIGNRIKGNTSITAQDYASLIDRVKDRPDFHLIQTVLLRSLSQAVYSPDNEGHFGLSLENYAHFTSPIRRYPDLLVHRAIRHITQGNKASTFFYRHSDMVSLGEHCSSNERRADEATRDAVTALKCEFMQTHIGETFYGIITSVTSFGVFVELNDIYVEGLIHITSLPKDYYQFEPVTHRLIGERGGKEFQLGDSVVVNVVGVNMDERKIDFELVDHENKRAARTGTGAGKSAAKSKAKKSSGKAVGKKDTRKRTARTDKAPDAKKTDRKKSVTKKKTRKRTSKNTGNEN